MLPVIGTSPFKRSLLGIGCALHIKQSQLRETSQKLLFFMSASCSQRPVWLLLLQGTLILICAPLPKSHPSWNQGFLLPFYTDKCSSPLFRVPACPTSAINLPRYSSILPGHALVRTTTQRLPVWHPPATGAHADLLSSLPSMKGIACFFVTFISSSSNTYYLTFPEHSREFSSFFVWNKLSALDT